VFKRGCSTHLNEKKKSQSTYAQISMSAETWESFREVRIFRIAEEDPGISMRRIPDAEGIGGPLVWRILHEQ
jgi:hypothetical protein